MSWIDGLTPEQIEERRRYARERARRPEVIERRREYEQRPEVRERIRKYYNEKQRIRALERSRRPEVKRQRQQREQQPEMQERLREYKRRQYLDDRDKVVSRNRYRQYRLSPAGYLALQQQQAGLCAICRKEPAVHVDHDHSWPHHVRGLLCRGCNLGLGLFIDDPDRMRRAAEYIECHRAAAGADGQAVFPFSEEESA